MDDQVLALEHGGEKRSSPAIETEASVKDEPVIEADVQLQRMGLRVEATRNISSFEIICLAWNVSNSWMGIAGTMALSIALGGTVTTIYGILVVFVMGGCSALTLAELASVYPTAGGQYHWASILAPARWRRGISYWCGALNVFGWIALVSSVGIIWPQFILAIAIELSPSYVPHAWHYFMLYQALNILIMIYNIVALKRTPWIHNIGFGLSLSAFFVILITCLARSQQKQPSDFVWATFINSSGWKSDGVTFLIGLVSANYMYAGLDSAAHLAEECSNAATAVPRAFVCTVVLGFVTAFAFAVALTYAMTDFTAVLETPTGLPTFELYRQSTRSEAAAIVFVFVMVFITLFSLTAGQLTASRLTWAFARDNGLILSRHIGRMHPSLDVPVWAIVFNSTVVFIIGCIYLGSSTAFNAIVGTGQVLQQITFGFPAALLLYRRRSVVWLPSTRSFKLGWFGWIANVLTLVYAFVVLVFFSFPPVLPVTGLNMNYTCAVLAGVAIFIAGNWIVHARKHYHGPNIPGLE